MKKMLIIILLVAAALRFWQLGAVPPSPDWDEAALGYNAYSILKTGRDEFGTFLPRVLRSFDDYKPPLYAYLAVPSVAAFGLEVWAVRLPSAIAGVLAVWGMYLLVSSITYQVSRKNDDALALLSAFLLAVSPWHIQFSRIAFEANIGLTLTIFAAYTFLRGLNSTKWFAISAFLFGLGLYAYHAQRIFLPLLGVALLIVYKEKLFSNRSRLATGVVIGLLTILPLLPVLFSSQSVTRLSGTSVFADQTGLLARSVEKLQDDQATRNMLGIVFDNRRVVYAQKLLDGYLSHFSLRWLFLTGDNERHHAPGIGLLYIVELPFLLWGIYLSWKKRDQASAVMFSWLLLAPVAASPTSETPHAIRTLVMLPAFVYFSANGIAAFLRKREVWARVAKAVFVAAFALNIMYFLHMYFVHLNIEYSEFWQYGYKQAVEYAQANRDTYKKIVVSTKLEQPHMFFLFFTKYDPVKYLTEGGTASGGFAEWRNRFDIYEFRPITSWKDEAHDGSILYIGTPEEIPSGIKYSISYLDGTEAIRIAR